ncbi:MAG TPA: EamA family transporter [Candidatus Atribacteria bacterium]|nr:EamA family transporter [Candidatus Atribacteria bacterium]
MDQSSSTKPAKREVKAQGILMMLIAAICFAVLAFLIKFVPDIPLMELIFFRNIPIMLIVPLILIKKGIPILGNKRPLLLLWGLLSIFSTISYFYTIKVMILTDAVSIKQFSPFLSVFFAAIFLKEKIGYKKVSIFIFGFLGALLVVKPGFRTDIFPAIVGLGGATLQAMGFSVVRYLRLSDHPMVVVNYFGYIVGLSSLGVLLWQGNFIVPNIRSLIILVLIGLVGLAGQYYLTLSYHMAPPKLVSLCLYLTIVFSAIFDTFIFKKAPDLFSIFGASLIIVSGYLNYKLKAE